MLLNNSYYICGVKQSKQFIMKKLEFDVIIYTSEESVEDKQLKNLGISINETSELKESKAKYSFMPDAVVEYRETIVKYKGDDVKGVVCTYRAEKRHYDSPILIVPYKEFEKKLNEYFND